MHRGSRELPSGGESGGSHKKTSALEGGRRVWQITARIRGEIANRLRRKQPEPTPQIAPRVEVVSVTSLPKGPTPAAQETIFDGTVSVLPPTASEPVPQTDFYPQRARERRPAPDPEGLLAVKAWQAARRGRELQHELTGGEEGHAQQPTSSGVPELDERQRTALERLSRERVLHVLTPYVLEEVRKGQQ